MPIIREQDILKYYDAKEMKLIQRGSGLFPAGHYPRKERSGDGLMDWIAQGAKVIKLIKENKDNIKGVAEAVAGVVTAGKKIKEAIAPATSTLAPVTPVTLATLAPSAESIDPQIYQKLRDSVKAGNGIKKGLGFKYD